MNEEVFQRYRKKLEEVIARERMSRETFKSYASCLRGYARFVCENGTTQWSKEEKVSRYLGTLCRHSASTQKQNLNALVFFYKKVLCDPVGDLPRWVYARRPKRLPTWLTEDEFLTLFRHMQGQPRTMAELMTGSGLRLKEAVSLRVQDIDFQGCGVKVRSGKGNKDRVTCLPKVLIPILEEQIETCREIWLQDRRNRVAPVSLPSGLERKYPRGGEQFEWFWLFPARSLVRSADHPVRWHIHQGTIGKALSTAKKRAGIPKRVTAHTLRHSFATASLMAGMPVHELKELMGHISLRTTEIYLHCLPLASSRAESPLDHALRQAENIVDFRKGDQSVAAA